MGRWEKALGEKAGWSECLGYVLAEEDQVLWMKGKLIQSLEELEVTSLTDSAGEMSLELGSRKWLIR